MSDLAPQSTYVTGAGVLVFGVPSLGLLTRTQLLTAIGLSCVSFYSVQDGLKLDIFRNSGMQGAKSFSCVDSSKQGTSGDVPWPFQLDFP